MKTFLSVGLMVLMSVVGWAADSTIHNLPTIPGEPDGAEYIPVDKQTSPGVWHNYKLLSGVVGAGKQTIVQTNYTVYGPNYYTNNTTIEQIFTNFFLTDNTVSNYFDQRSYTFNSYTNLSITNYIAGDTYVSNTVVNLITTNTTLTQYFQTNVTLNVTNSYTNIVGGAFIANNGGEGTNTLLYGSTAFKGISSAPGKLDIYSSDGLNLLGGFDMSKGGWWGPGLATIVNEIFNVTNITMQVKNLTVQSNITIVGGITASNLNASQYVATDAGKNLVSTRNLANGTNLFLTGITSPTNAYGSGATIDFAIPESTTNISAAVTFTGMQNWNPTNYNRAIVWIVNFSGSDRTITIPTGWGNDIARLTSTTYVATNNMVLGLFFACQLNQFTNCNSLR